MTLQKAMVLLITLFLSLICADPTEITNVQFTDDKGNSYDLFELLDRGTHVYIEMVDNN